MSPALVRAKVGAKVRIQVRATVRGRVGVRVQVEVGARARVGAGVKVIPEWRGGLLPHGRRYRADKRR